MGNLENIGRAKPRSCTSFEINETKARDIMMRLTSGCSHSTHGAFTAVRSHDNNGCGPKSRNNVSRVTFMRARRQEVNIWHFSLAAPSGSNTLP